MKNAKIAKIILKVGASILFAQALGQTYKLSKIADEKIDAYFEDDEASDDSDSDD